VSSWIVPAVPNFRTALLASRVELTNPSKSNGKKYRRLPAVSSKHQATNKCCVKGHGTRTKREEVKAQTEAKTVVFKTGDKLIETVQVQEPGTISDPRMYWETKIDCDGLSERAIDLPDVPSLKRFS
jgi:hypothetical protein